MKKLLIAFAISMFVCSLAYAKTVEEYINEAANFQQQDRIDKAIETMEQAVAEYPESSAAYFHLGNYIGLLAQRTQDYGEIFFAFEHAFQMWDKALELDPYNFEARFTRGAYGVNMPAFVGRLEQSVSDLEMMIDLIKQSPDPEAQAELMSAYYYVGTGYQKQGEWDKALEAYGNITAAQPMTDLGQSAQANIDEIRAFKEWQATQNETKKTTPEITVLEQQVEKNPKNAGVMIALGQAYFDAERYEDAEQMLKRSIQIDTTNVQAYRLLALVLGKRAEVGYDPRISMDTDFLTNLAFETMTVFDRAVAIAPDDPELRLYRGAMAVQMPFFVGRLEQGMADLEMVVESDASDSLKAQALYDLGVAHQKMAMTYWIEVVSKFPETDATEYVFDRLKPLVEHIDLTSYKRPFVIVDFVLGFKDELAPQTAVWVETADGVFVRTIYVSGFSGYAKGKQVNLPMWANASKFADVDGVTAASIDLGHHIYVWNMKDILGKQVKKGSYRIKIEVSFWPSMQYQRVEVPFSIGKKDERVVVEEGNLIPYVEVKYIGS
jgi:tetratricopeptide (TPR) repeat protein